MKRHHPLLMLVLAFGLAFAFAMFWVVFMFATLPRTDGAYGQAPFQDPLVFLGTVVFAGIAAVITYPFLYFALRDRQFPRAPVILAATVFLEIFIVTPFHANLGFLGAFVAYMLGLWLARAWTPINVLPGHCVSCGYCLRGIPSSHPCPECGMSQPLNPLN